MDDTRQVTKPTNCKKNKERKERKMNIRRETKEGLINDVKLRRRNKME